MTVDVMAEARDPSVWLLIGLVAVTLISFWIQAIITEERFVPALNVISNHYRIPSDIAGATLMAAGASSPVLLSSFMTLFVSHSSLGLGTILGSEIFNQLIIVSGAIFASPTVGLRLDPAIVIREVGFYALSILLLYMALRDTRPDNNGVYYIYINFGVSCYVLAGYIVYVLVCANMDAIAAVFGSFQQHDNEKCHDLRSNEYGGGDGCDARQVLPSRSATLSMESTASPTRRGVSFDHIDCPDRKRKMPFLCEKSLMTREPSSNFETVEFSKSHPGGEMLHNVGDLLVIVGSSACGLGVDGGECIMHETKPSREHGLYDMEVSEVRF